MTALVNKELILLARCDPIAVKIGSPGSDG